LPLLRPSKFPDPAARLQTVYPGLETSALVRKRPNFGKGYCFRGEFRVSFRP
jgi:hypothetical protein